MVVAGRRRIGAYELIEPVGHGGSAVVYRAYDAARGEVAIKVISGPHAADPGFRARFHQEADLVSQLFHPHILRVLDSGQVEDAGWRTIPESVAYLVTEYMPGGSLADLIPTAGTVRQRSLLALTVAQQIGAALDWAHEAGVLHRDVKPSNVLIARDGRYVLSDFGLARLLQSSSTSLHLTATGLVAGTPAYMAPEQALGHPADARTDVYSLGVVLYEVLTGRVPFDAETPMAVMLAHVHQPPAPPSDLKRGLPAAISSVVLSALAKEPDARPQTATELGTLLRAAVASCYGESCIDTGTYALLPPQSRPDLVRAAPNAAHAPQAERRSSDIRRAARRPARRIGWRLPVIAAGIVAGTALATAGAAAAVAGPGRLHVVGWLTRFIADSVPLGVSEALPRENASGQALRPVITVYFNRPMDQQSVQDAFALEDVSTHERVPVDFAWEGQMLQVQPRAELRTAAAYRFVVGKQARDLEGRELSGDLDRRFFTVAAPPQPPNVAVAAPAPLDAGRPSPETRATVAPTLTLPRPTVQPAPTTPPRPTSAPATSTPYALPTLPAAAPDTAQVAGLLLEANGTPHILTDEPEGVAATPVPLTATAVVLAPTPIGLPATATAPSAMQTATARAAATSAAATATMNAAPTVTAQSATARAATATAAPTVQAQTSVQVSNATASPVSQATAPAATAQPQASVSAPLASATTAPAAPTAVPATALPAQPTATSAVAGATTAPRLNPTAD